MTKKKTVEEHVRLINQAWDSMFDDDLYPPLRRQVLEALEQAIAKVECSTAEDVDNAGLMAIDIYQDLLEAGFSIIKRPVVDISPTTV